MQIEFNVKLDVSLEEIYKLTTIKLDLGLDDLFAAIKKEENKNKEDTNNK